MSKKDAYWFRHDATAGRAIKMRKMAFIHGHWGKGVYWDVVEILRDQENYSFECDERSLLMLCDLIGCKDQTKFLNWFKDCVKIDLLQIENESFVCPALLESMEVWETKKSNGSKGGRPKKNRNETELKPKQKPNQKRNETIIEQNRTEQNITDPNFADANMDYTELLKYFNKKSGRNETTVTPSIKLNVKERMGELIGKGLSQDEAMKSVYRAIFNASFDQWLKDNNVLTLFWITKTDNFYKWLDTPPKQKAKAPASV